MSLTRDIERLEDLSSALSTQAASLTSNLLANDEESIKNLKNKIDDAVNELELGIVDLKKYLSKMENQKNYWS